MKNSDSGTARVWQWTKRRYSKIKVAARTEFISTAVGARGPEKHPKRVLELHGGKDGMGAAMQIADAVEPFDH